MYGTMNLTVSTHASVADPDSCRQLLATALKRFAPDAVLPVAIQRRLTGRVHLWLPPLLEADFIAYRRKVAAMHAERFRTDERGSFAADSALVAAMIESLIVAPPSAHAEDAGEEERRVLQSRLLAGLESGLRHEQIVFLEGSTGLGKSRVMAVAALKLLAEEGGTKPVGLVAPTVAGLAHLAAEVRLAAESGVGLPLPPTAVLLGRRQFVSVEKVRALATDLLETLPDAGGSRDTDAWMAAREALAWIERGGPPVTRASRYLAELCPDLCLLSEDLCAQIPMWAELYDPSDYQLDAEAAAVQANEDDDEEKLLALLDPAERLYRHLHLMAEGVSASGKGAPLVLLTQAKLCYAARQTVFTRSGGLPKWKALIIDEAHDLERQMSSACSRELSLLWLRAELRRIAVKDGVSTATTNRARETVTALTAVIDLFRSEAVRRKLDRGGMGALRISSRELLSAHPGFKEAVNRLLGALRAVCHRRGDQTAPAQTKAKNKKRTRFPAGLNREQFYRLSNWADGLDDIVKGIGSVTVVYSPVRRFPSLVVGPRSLTTFLTALWNSTEAAGLFSATLFHLGKDGRASCGYLQHKLAVNRTRAAEVVPCHATWVWSTPTLFLPTAKTAVRLTYPSGMGQEEAEAVPPHDEAADPERIAPAELKKWWVRVAQQINHIATSAVGGMLVLCCSYRDMEALARRMEGTAPRLVIQKRGVALARLKELFVSLARAGERPIWLATGGAWTGLDLRDELADDPASDRLLTDLIIPRLPFGQNRSAEHQSRMKYFGFDAEASETEMMLRQGMGRAVRRPGLLDRRIWMLDGRILGPRAAYYQRMIGVLLRYPKRCGF